MSIVAANGIRICGRYTLLGKLGEGGEGEVWRARDHEQGKEVALKILRPEIAQRPGSWEALEREHAIASGLDHPLILKIDAPVQDGDTVALPMELAPDGDLRRLCGVSYLEIVPVLMEVAQALAYAHEHGVVHRDLKPSNVLFDARGHVRVADFGSSRAGLSPFTASPQQLRGEPPSVADDIYGLGALAYELLSGHPPYHPRFEARRALEEPVPSLKPAHLAPGRLVALVMSMLAKRPSERPASMSDVLEALDVGLNDTLPFAYEETRDAPRSSAALVHTQPPAAERIARPVRTPPAPAAPAVLQASATALPATSATGQASAASAHAVRATGHAASASGHAPMTAPQAVGMSGPVKTAAEQVPLGSARVSPASDQAPAAPTTHAKRTPAAAPLRAERAPPEPELRALWPDIKVERVPNLMKLEPVHHSRWPLALVAGIAAVAVIVFFVLHGSVSRGSWGTPSLAQLRSIASPQMVQAMRGAVEAPLRAMQRGGHVSGDDPGQAANTPDAGSVTDSTSPAVGRATAPDQAPTSMSDHAPPAPGEPSTAGHTASARDRVAAVNRSAARVSNGAARTDAAAQAAGAARPARSRGARTLPAVAAAGLAATATGTLAGAAHPIARGESSDSGAPAAIQALLRNARQAEATREYSRAAQDYSQALALDSGNAEARAGLQRANAAFGAGEYAESVGAGFAALGAGRLEEARADFQRARGFDRGRLEAVRGLKRVNAALRVRDAAESRARARADLENRMQAFVDAPQRLDSPAMRAEAASLIREAQAARPAGAILQALAQRLAALLPAYDKPVHLALVSDNVTQVAIPQIGSFGTFARRDIDLKPGRYTVIGTRAGYREVRRDVTVAPGQGLRTISIRCEVPI